MCKNKKFAIVSCLLIGAFIMSSQVFAQNSKEKSLKFKLQVKETYTDHVDIDSLNSEGDFITQIIPEVILHWSSPKLMASVNYTYNLTYYPQSKGNKTEGSHNLNANISGELIEDFFFLNGYARINKRYIDRRKAISYFDTARSKNRRTVQSYQINPYIQHYFGNFAQIKVGYNFNLLRFSHLENSKPQSNYRHNYSAVLSSGQNFKKFGWALSANHSEEKARFSNAFGGERLIKNSIFRFDANYQFNRFFSLLGSAGFQNNVAGSHFADFKGMVWDVGFRFTPGPKTSLSARFGRQNRNNTYSAELFYRFSESSSLSVSYNNLLTTFQAIEYDGNNNPLNPNNIDGSTLGFDGFTKYEVIAVNLNTKRGRTEFYIRGSYASHNSEDINRSQKYINMTAGLSRALGKRLKLNLSAGINRIKIKKTGDVDRLLTGSASLSYSIANRTSLSLSYTHSKRIGAIENYLNRDINYISFGVKREF